MIKILKEGQYKLIETKRHTKVLTLDTLSFAWVEPAHIGEILVLSHRAHKTDCVLSVGRYLLFSVQDEPQFSDHIHLELEVGLNYWQGYILLTGLPDGQKKKSRIIPTTELIVGNYPNDIHVSQNYDASDQKLHNVI